MRQRDWRETPAKIEAFRKLVATNMTPASSGWENNEGRKIWLQTCNEKWQAGCDWLVLQHLWRLRNESCGSLRSCSGGLSESAGLRQHRAFPPSERYGQRNHSHQLKAKLKLILWPCKHPAVWIWDQVSLIVAAEQWWKTLEFQITVKPKTQQIISWPTYYLPTRIHGSK